MYVIVSKEKTSQTFYMDILTLLISEITTLCIRFQVLTGKMELQIENT
jgi:hypothetical protein